MRDLLSAFQMNVTAAVTSTGGYVARVIGDGLLIYFGWPHADEAHAESAVRAGLAIIDTTPAQHLSVRVGIASGLVLIGDLMGAGATRELMAVGETVHLAARLQALAAPDTIVVSDATHAQTSLLFEMEDLGPVDLKGFSTVQRVWRVHRETALSGRSEALFASTQAPIVGRDEELEFLLRQWRQTIAGDGRVVLLSGEAGIGKSRLLAALEERLAGERHYNLRYFCSPYHQDDALYPIISRWEREIGFARADTPEDRLRKLEATVASRGIAPNDTPLLAAMLSVPLGDRYPRLDLSAQRLKEKTFDMLIGRLESLARVRPVLVMFEDAHWADPTTIELVEAGIDRLAGLPVFRIISFRSEFIPPWTGRPNVSVLNAGTTRPPCVHGARQSGRGAACAAAGAARPDHSSNRRHSPFHRGDDQGSPGRDDRPADLKRSDRGSQHVAGIAHGAPRSAAGRKAGGATWGRDRPELFPRIAGRHRQPPGGIACARAGRACRIRSCVSARRRLRGVVCLQTLSRPRRGL